MTPIVVTKTELAARLGLTKGRITQFCKAGMPVRPDGRLDLYAALAWVTTTRQCQASYDSEPEAAPEPERIGDGPRIMPLKSTDAPIPPPASTYADARANRESALAALAQLKLATERGELVEVSVIKRDWVSTLTSLRGRLLAIPARVAATLPHLSPADVATIGTEVRQALEELAHADMA